MNKSVSLALAFAVAFSAASAHATTITGSDPITFFQVSASPDGGTSLFPISGINDFTYAFGVTSGTGTMDFASIPVGTMLTGSTALYPNTPLGGIGTTAFSFSIGTYGTFTETAAPEIVTNGGNSGSSAVNIYLLGTFDPMGTLSSFSSGPASFDVSFNENGSQAAGYAYTGSGPLTSPPAGIGATPEPSSLILLGTGLVGLAGATRRKFRRA